MDGIAGLFEAMAELRRRIAELEREFRERTRVVDQPAIHIGAIAPAAPVVNHVWVKTGGPTTVVKTWNGSAWI